MFTSLNPGASPSRVPAAPPADPLAVPATHMPFMALTTGERGLYVPPLTITKDDGWVRYIDPSPYDRYPGFDVLLMRTLGSPSGRPVGAQVCPYRQALCMVELLCQGCRRPAARNPDGPSTGFGHPLFVLPRHHSDGSLNPAAGITDMPPSCAACAVSWCPVLQERGRQLVWAARAELVGVFGRLYVPGTGGMREERYVELAGTEVEERKLSTVVANSFARDLQDVTPADPDVVRRLAAEQTRTTARVPSGRR